MSGLRLTIGIKLNSIVIGLQVLTTIGVVVIATLLFSEELPGVLRKANHDVATLLASRVRAEILLVSDRMRNVGSASLESFAGEAQKARFLEDIVSVDGQLLDVALYEIHGSGPSLTHRLLWRVMNKSLAAGDKVDAATFETLDRQAVGNLATLKSGKVEFVPAVLRDGRAIMRIVVPFAEAEKGVYHRFLVADVRQDRLAALFKESSAHAAFLLDAKKRVLVSSDPARFKVNAQFDEGDTRAYMTSIHPAGVNDLQVVAQAPLHQVESAKDRLYKRTGLLALLFASLATWLAVMFSRGIKASIDRLAEAAQRVIRGDFQTRISLEGESGFFANDEIREVSFTFNEMLRGLEEKNRVKSAFQKLHGEKLANRMMSGQLKLGGERRNCVVMFSDIRGFTTLSEKMDPVHLVEILNRYLGVMIDIIEKHNGTVTSFQGDGIMAVWGLSESGPDDVDGAIDACLTMRKALAEFNASLVSEGRKPIYIGMGLHYGPVVAGTIGSESRMEYSVIGDTTNTAARVESATKEFGTDFLVSESLLERARTTYLVEQVEARLKGKQDVVKMFKVHGYVGEGEVVEMIRTPYCQFDPERMNNVLFHEQFITQAYDADDKTVVTNLHIFLNDVDPSDTPTVIRMIEKKKSS